MIAQSTLPIASFLSDTDEDRWFAERERQKKRPSFSPPPERGPLGSSPTTPPPIGDQVADRWFR